MCAGQNSLWMRTENGTNTQVLTVYHVFHGALLYSIANGMKQEKKSMKKIAWEYICNMVEVGGK
jgi:hypothetical protein